MDKSEGRVCGIMGGMGAEATVDLMRKIVLHTDARNDHEYPHCIVDQNPDIPSRIDFIMGENEESPGPILVERGKFLEKAGADFLAMPCNTAHYWRPDIRDAVSIPILDMIELAAGAAAALDWSGSPENERIVAILGSPGTHKAGLYEKPCRAHGLLPIYAEGDWEERLHGLIRSIKAGHPGEKEQAEWGEIVRHVRSKGAKAIIIACTELGILDKAEDIPAVDAAEILAIEIVRASGCKIRP